ncbi:MAG: type II toxin-antitoxin system VapC family toxin [Actinomycetota bacterium]|nr:type II toxin-antitoxin system VapC family toxin [Actinomycetota bacterium]
MKLVVPEPESAALESALADRVLVASEVVEIELRRAARRAGPDAERLVDLDLAQVSLVPLSARIRRAAGTLSPASLRTLDAIHLATALALGELDAVISYDRRLAHAARDRGLPVLSPA